MLGPLAKAPTSVNLLPFLLMCNQLIRTYVFHRPTPKIFKQSLQWTWEPCQYSKDPFPSEFTVCSHSSERCFPKQKCKYAQTSQIKPPAPNVLYKAVYTRGKKFPTVTASESAKFERAVILLIETRIAHHSWTPVQNHPPPRRRGISAWHTGLVKD